MEFLGIKVYDENFLELLIRSAFNLFIVYIIISTCYLKGRKFNSHVFSFYAFSVMIFFVCHLMSNVKLDFGVAFGLFAIFAMLRYRTNPIPIREMTYLFIVMGIAVINALSNKKVSYMELLFTNFAIVVFIYFIERYSRYAQNGKADVAPPKIKLDKKKILYKGLEHIKPQDQSILIKDLTRLTGLNIHSVDIQSINFPEETMVVEILFAKTNETD